MENGHFGFLDFHINLRYQIQPLQPLGQKGLQIHHKLQIMKLDELLHKMQLHALQPGHQLQVSKALKPLLQGLHYETMHSANSGGQICGT